MTKIKVAYLPIGRVSFHMESASDVFQKSCNMLKEIFADIQMPKDVLTSPEVLSQYIESTHKPDLVIFQNTTFADSAFAAEVVRRLDCHILLWTVMEPVIDGGRLRLNSLTGAFSAGNLFLGQGRKFDYILGAPGEEKVAKKIKVVVSAIKLKNSLREITVGVVGTAPGGFYFANALDTDILRVIGARLENIEAREIINKAKALKEEEFQGHIDELKNTLKNIEVIPNENIERYARLSVAYTRFVEDNGINVLASRCWPDFFVEYEAPVCGVLSSLTDKGVVSSCEGDVYGAVSMYILKELTSISSYFGDPVSIDETKNTITFWHCGAGACSLARTDTGARAGVHPNRKIGPTMEFGLRPGRVTVMRLGRSEDGTFRIFLMGGEALDEPKQFLGTSVVIKTDNNASQIINSAVQAGWEPHFAIGYGDVREEIIVLGKLLNIDVIEY
ncbi:MAG: hypothetical protein APF76_09610 [Desulfitibacter sp. BRH_c19]|nr:MAG: hypothetical protein APF76_09610 [Desulfitibacter sp. BRH_c19]